MNEKKVNKKRWSFIIVVCVITLILSIIVFSTVGSANIKTTDTFRIVLSKIPLIGKQIDISDMPKSYQTIILNVRIPRVLIGVIVGAALAGVGAVFQGMFKNPMADPYVIGISSGAALGAGLVIISGITWTALGMSSISIGAFIGAISSTFLVYWISKVKNKVPVTILLLSGVAVGQFLTAILSFLMVIYTKDMSKIIYWTLGSFSGKGWEHLASVSIPMILSMIIINFFSRELNIMLLGEESAQNLGINVEKTKIIILIICSFIISIAVSVSGIIGFVGLIIPHIVRLIVGPDHRILIPTSMLVGGIFMIFADTLARTIISPTEIPVGIITALFGGPFFIYLLRKSKKSI
ncbi:iron chelate uptake ABC transporter family permease subunit [Proteiniborus sp. MB09-C3]|uniref:FecCD family ABC transporter permease n=1 Tax=Proteiniborus sp. MB09-C3 TaxID=3050072 RepID=UPI0025555DE0|nr:iron chelate uptake ABC transporter family permease subunit [Proteiniborus sp. MB09-C3]WIV13874.1 iron chelate uptake ABC transporter family permease subunit [Proteiniborus sp. MB09-C3]